jgi:hypothetical protein
VAQSGSGFFEKCVSLTVGDFFLGRLAVHRRNHVAFPDALQRCFAHRIHRRFDENRSNVGIGGLDLTILRLWIDQGNGLVKADCNFD